MSRDADLQEETLPGYDRPSRRTFLASHLLPGALSLRATWTHGSTDTLGSNPVACQGRYPDHLQGVCADEHNNLFWSFTTVLVKTDSTGTVLTQAKVPPHHGSPCYTAGRLYVPVNLTVFNDASQPADSWIYVYDPAHLTLLSRHRAAEVVYGAGGMAFHDGRFLVVGGLPEGYRENYLYQYDAELRFLREVRLKSGYTRKGIQTAVFGDGYWWFGCYASPGETEVLLRCDERLGSVSRFPFDCSLGILKAGRGYLVARSDGACTPHAGCSGTLLPAVPRATSGLALAPGTAASSATSP